jgi:hypothetical protein
VDAALDSDGSLVVAGGGDGVLRFWDAASGNMIWTVRAHRFAAAGIHFENDDLVTRGLTGEVSRWAMPRRLSPEGLQSIDDVLRCLPVRLDKATGNLVEQPPCGEPPSSAMLEGRDLVQPAGRTH